MKKTVSLEGMSCSHCAAAVTRALISLAGASNVEVMLEAKQATLDANENLTDDIIREAIEDQGYEVTDIQ